TTSRSLTYDLSKFDNFSSSAQATRTSDTESFAKLPDVAVSNNSLSVTLNPNSITTYVISDRTSINDRSTGTGRNQFDYSGAWSNIAQTGAYIGDNSWSGSTDASYHVRFHGT